MNTIRLTAHYYQQFDADLSRDVPGEGYGGWRQAPVEISAEHTAVVAMHAWEAGTPDRYPGWYRAVEYIPRAQRIAAEVFPPLLQAVRASPLPLFHVVGGRDYYSGYPGHRRAADLAGPDPPPPPQVETDPVLERLRQFRREHVFVGGHNREDVDRGFAALDFMPQARPVGDEGVAENGAQLFALCRHAGVNHLLYAGFAINWCLLLSPGGMAEMQRYGVMCSALRQAVTAVENRETARGELGKELGLWRVALAFGFVFDVDELVRALGPGEDER
ncbi:MAG: hypothetical protein AB1505_14930 [Candidatus Latescibacterota bacterium]